MPNELVSLGGLIELIWEPIRLNELLELSARSELSEPRGLGELRQQIDLRKGAPEETQ